MVLGCRWAQKLSIMAEKPRFRRRAVFAKILGLGVGFGYRNNTSSNAAKTRNPFKFGGVPQTGKSISAAIGPKFTILWGHVEDILRLTSFFPIVDTSLSCEDIARHSCAMVPTAQMAIIGDFFASCVFSEPRAAGFRPASEIRTKATPGVEVWQTSNLRRLRLGEGKKERRKKEVMAGQKYNGLPYSIGRP